MKLLYLDCGMGAAGDMLTAALLELLPEAEIEGVVDEMNRIGLTGVTFVRERSIKCGITGTHVSVLVDGQEETVCGDRQDFAHEHAGECGYSQIHAHAGECGYSQIHGYAGECGYSQIHEHDGESGHEDTHEHAGGQEAGHEPACTHTHAHHHSGMQDIARIVDSLHVEADVKADILAVYSRIAEAESHVHGRPVDQIHFHEVGSRDAIADITAVCLLMKRLAPDEVVVSPVHVGSGNVSCAHGILPVPAPATAYLLKGVPIYGGAVRGELCTPTGAALLTYFADRFGDMPVMKPVAVGYGMGKKDFEAANCVRAMLGEAEDTSEIVPELSCNVDDMTAEDIGFAIERLYESGALEVYTIPVGMKKNRPGTLLRVMCSETNKQALVECLFRHTSTIGIRETVTRRYILKREMKMVPTPYGDVHVKSASGYGVSRKKYEYEDLARIARERGIGLSEVRLLLQEERLPE